MSAHNEPTDQGNRKSRRRRTHCGAGHDLAEHGYPALNGDDKAFTRCRLCHVERVRRWRRNRARLP
jgi:hypothetical protein